jgi:hypothetical protein
MAPRLFPSPRYLLRLLGIYSAGAFIFGVTFFFVVALIARPGSTLLFVSGVITGGLTALLILTARSKAAWWEHIAHPFDHQSA